MIYFIKSNEYVKIGYTSKDITNRIYELQTGNPIKLILIGYMDGTTKKEAEIHKRFKKFNVKDSGKEWFILSEEIYNFIKKNCKLVVRQKPVCINQGSIFKTISESDDIAEFYKNALKDTDFFDGIRDMVSRHTIFQVSRKIAA